MANSLLTPTAVTREILRILHQKCSFIGSINRQYDSSFAKTGAKIGDSLKIRLPNEYTVRSGKTLQAQDTSETSVTLQVATQKGVDINFSSADLTMSMDDFSKRVLDPAISVLAANLESTAYGMYKDIYQTVDNDGSALTFKNVMQGRQNLNNALAPYNNRTYMLSTGHQVTLIDALKGLFHDDKSVTKQYREGMMGRTAGGDWYENTHVLDHTTGTAAKTTSYVTNGAAQSGATLTVDGGTTTFLIGDVITVADVFRVHPETKVSTGVLQQFVITADSGATATSLAISPSIVASGARQNVNAAAGDGKAIVKVGAGASETMNSSMVYQEDAFTFATADLEMPSGVDFAAREVFDGISMRIVRQYDINNDNFPCRVDVLSGQKTIRPQLASRIHADG